MTTGPWAIFLQESAEDLPDHWVTSSRFLGSSTTAAGATVIGFTDSDTLKDLVFTTEITEGQARSVHEQDDSTDYQNTSGENAYAVLTFRALTGSEERHVKVYSAPTTNDTTGATFLWEFGDDADSALFHAVNDRITTPPLTISNNHYIVVENVDESRAGSNNFTVEAIRSFVIERG